LNTFFGDGEGHSWPGSRKNRQSGYRNYGLLTAGAGFETYINPLTFCPYISSLLDNATRAIITPLFAFARWLWVFFAILLFFPSNPAKSASK